MNKSVKLSCDPELGVIGQWLQKNKLFVNNKCLFTYWLFASIFVTFLQFRWVYKLIDKYVDEK
jgi:hypothetical protein